MWPDDYELRPADFEVWGNRAKSLQGDIDQFAAEIASAESRHAYSCPGPFCSYLKAADNALEEFAAAIDLLRRQNYLCAEGHTGLDVAATS